MFLLASGAIAKPGVTHFDNFARGFPSHDVADLMGDGKWVYGPPATPTPYGTETIVQHPNHLEIIGDYSGIVPDGLAIDHWAVSRDETHPTQWARYTVEDDEFIEFEVEMSYQLNVPEGSAGNPWKAQGVSDTDFRLGHAGIILADSETLQTVCFFMNNTAIYAFSDPLGINGDLFFWGESVSTPVYAVAQNNVKFLKHRTPDQVHKFVSRHNHKTGENHWILDGQVVASNTYPASGPGFVKIQERVVGGVPVGAQGNRFTVGIFGNVVALHTASVDDPTSPGLLSGNSVYNIPTSFLSDIADYSTGFLDYGQMAISKFYRSRVKIGKVGGSDDTMP